MDPYSIKLWDESIKWKKKKKKTNKQKSEEKTMSVKSIKEQLDLGIPERIIEESQPSFSYTSLLKTRQSLRLFSPLYESTSALATSEANVRHSAMLDKILSRLTGEGAGFSSGNYWTRHRIDNVFLWRWLNQE